MTVPSSATAGQRGDAPVRLADAAIRAAERAALALTIDEIRRLPAVVDLPTAGRCLGIGRGASYDLARRGEFPAPVLRLGNRYRVPLAGILRSLGVDPDAPSRG